MAKTAPHRHLNRPQNILPTDGAKQESILINNRIDFGFGTSHSLCQFNDAIVRRHRQHSLAHQLLNTGHLLAGVRGFNTGPQTIML